MDHSHGGNWLDYEQQYQHKPLDYSANINPYGLPKSVQDALIQAVNGVDRYPDPSCRRLCAALGKQHHVPSSWILCGNGAADLIFRMILAIKPRQALITAPTFSEYEKALRIVDASITYYSLSKDQQFLLDDSFLEAITPKLDLVILCNPNNPTGQPIDRLLFQKVLDRCEQTNTYLLLDECFQDFLPQELAQSAILFLQQYPHTAVLRAFTKLYAMPGVRLGYLLSSNESLLEQISDCGQAWSVSYLAEEAGLAAIEEIHLAKQQVAVLQKERKRISDWMQEHGISHWGKANFLLFYWKQGDLCARFAKQGILLRSCANYRGLNENYYRMAVRLPNENDRFLNLLDQFIREECCG